MATMVLTGKSGPSSSSSILLVPSLPTSTVTTCHVSQASNEAARWAKATCKNRLPEPAAAAQSDTPALQLTGTSLTARPRSQQHLGAPATSWELPQPQCPCSGTARPLPAPSSPQTPAGSLTSNFTFFLGRISGQLPKHTYFFVSASCCHHKDTWDGWRWGPTTEQIDIAGISLGTHKQCTWTGRHTWATTGHEATQGARPAPHNPGAGAPISHGLPIPPWQAPQPARAGLNAAPRAFWGESLIFQGRLDTQGLTLITGSGH